MALFLAQANLSIVGQQIEWGKEYDLPADHPEVIACAEYLMPKLADGTYALPKPPEPIRCCGS